LARKPSIERPPPSGKGEARRKPRRGMYHYNKSFRPFARELRCNMTKAEIILWRKIRRKQIHDTQFLRQRPIGPFILDFYARTIKLALEIDGGQHFTKVHQDKDKNRDHYLAEFGIRTLRFTNSEILKDCSAVLSRIEAEVLKLHNRHPPAS
jgi:very-short-patch-repair endonuclease